MNSDKVIDAPVQETNELPVTEANDETADGAKEEPVPEEAQSAGEDIHTDIETEDETPETEEQLDIEPEDDDDDFEIAEDEIPIEEQVIENITDEEPGEDTPEKRFPMKKFLKITGIIVGVLAALYLAGVAYYSSHFFFNTNIGNFDCSNLSVKAAAEKIKTDINGYTFTIIDRSGAMESISGNDISLAYEAMGSLDDLKALQNPFLWVTDYSCRELSVDIQISYDENALYDKITALKCVAASNADMTGATENVYYDDDTMLYNIWDDGDNNVISVNTLFEKACAGISGLYKNMYLEDEGCYAGIAGDDKMKQALDTLNRCVSTKVSYIRGDSGPYLDGGSIHEWLTLSDDYTVNIDTNAVKSWVKDLAGIYNTIGGSRTFVTSYGDTVTVDGGDYGWQVNVDAETEALTEIIWGGGEISREPEYRQTAGTHGANNDLSNTYVEVNINAQHVWFYKDGELIVSTDCVTGDPTQNNSTHTGTYYLKYKERNATLKGEDYETPVDYWMPFNGGEGLHDATWRGAFGGSIYRGGGSHGCVNLPHDIAKKIYENIERGVPIVVY